MQPAANALNYSIKNIWNDIRQIIYIYEKSQFNSLVWGSLMLAPGCQKGKTPFTHNRGKSILSTTVLLVIRARFESSWRLFKVGVQVGQVENAETETEVRKRKYGSGKNSRLSVVGLTNVACRQRLTVSKRCESQVWTPASTNTVV